MFKPMKAPRNVPANDPSYFSRLVYPLYGSPKLDGIRCYKLSVKDPLRSSTGKIIPSRQAQEMFAHTEYVDGELTAGPVNHPNVYNRTQSAIMSVDKEDDIAFNIFDTIHPDILGLPFFERLEIMRELPQQDTQLVEQVLLSNKEELLQYEQEKLLDMYEGLMLRSVIGTYKFGRCTPREGTIFKLKRFEDTEDVVVDILPAFTNTNTQEKDDLGYAHRSQSKDGLVQSDMAGKYVLADGVVVGPGKFTHEERRRHLLSKELYIGRVLKYRHFPHGALKTKRQPTALGWRYDI